MGLTTSTIILEIFLGDRRNDFVDMLSGFKLKWAQLHANQDVGVHVIVPEVTQVQFTLEGIQHQTDYRTLDLAKIMIGPVALKRLRFTPGELTPDQYTAITGQ